MSSHPPSNLERQGPCSNSSPVAGAVKTADSRWMKAVPGCALLKSRLLLCSWGPSAGSWGNVRPAIWLGCRRQVSSLTPVPPEKTACALVEAQGSLVHQRVEAPEAVRVQGVLPSRML